ncbi:MAG: putative lipid II flippase FtsW [Desulfobacterales bacterium]|jgi:cell division protein FtsW|nr:putative lipid II flippase FtsW [Desulfobacterales bacterium]
MTAASAIAVAPRQAQGTTYDLQLLFPVLFLVGIGIVMVYSASSALALKKFGSDYYFLKKQALFAALGICLLVTSRHVPYRLYRPLAYPILAIALVLLAAVLVSPWAVTAGGSSRWLGIGGLRFQPAEFARFALIVYLAYSLEKKAPLIKDAAVGFFPHVVVMGVLALLILRQPDFGSAVILAGLTWVMMFVGGVRLSYLLGTCVVLGAAAAYFIMHAEYRLRRVMTFLDPWQYSSDEGYQIVHSLMAFGSGGWWGAGIGNSHQKLFYLPEPHTDFIFSVIGEELGLAGVIVIICLYALIVWKGVRIARNAPDLFGVYLALGLTTALGLQICINMGVTLGLLPTKGLTLPFLSYGGSSLVLNMATIGILMNIGAAGRAAWRPAR